PIGDEEEDGSAPGSGTADVSIRVVDLLGGVLPQEDGQSIDDDEVAEIVERYMASDAVTPPDAPPELVGTNIEGEPALGAGKGQDAEEPVAPNTTILAKAGDEGGSSDLDILKPVVKTVREGQKLSQ